MTKIEAILLYGSRARGDGRRQSDVDLLGITDADEIAKPYDTGGISLHLYPFDWLEREARQGSLFLLHIVKEAQVVFDPLARLDTIKESFVYKDSYVKDVEIGCRIIAAVVSLPEERMNKTIIRRYFWGMRTALMAASADKRAPLFSASDLEASFSIAGLERHIADRSNAYPKECREFGLTIYQKLMGTSLPDDQGSIRRNLDFIMGLGGIATATAGEIIYGIGGGL